MSASKIPGLLDGAIAVAIMNLLLTLTQKVLTLQLARVLLVLPAEHKQAVLQTHLPMESGFCRLQAKPSVQSLDTQTERRSGTSCPESARFSPAALLPAESGRLRQIGFLEH